MLAAFSAALFAFAGCMLLAPPPVRRGYRDVRDGGADRGRPGRWLRRPDAGRSTAAESPPDAALMLDLLAAMFRAGASLPAAVRTLARIAGGDSRLRLEKVAAALQLGTEWNNAWALAGSDEGLAGIREALTFGAATGAPSADILHAQAEQLRRRRKQEAERRAAALGTKLVLPLGLCSLPSFVCLGIVPVLISLLPQL